VLGEDSCLIACQVDDARLDAELGENLLRPVRWRETLLALRAAGVGVPVLAGGAGVADGSRRASKSAHDAARPA